MSYISNKDFLLKVHKGNVPGHSIIHKFGHGVVGTTLTPVTDSLTYSTPTTATALEIVSDDANDNSTGTGAREVTITGLDASWNEITQTVVPNGLTAVALTTNLTRLYRFYVSQSGSYSTASAGSHAGNLSIRESGAGATWETIENTPIALGQSEIGVYSVPTGYTAYILAQSLEVDSTKSVDIYAFKRENADDVTVPYTGAFRVVERFVGLKGPLDINHASAKSPIVGPADYGYMAQVSSGSADVSVNFEILLVQDGF